MKTITSKTIDNARTLNTLVDTLLEEKTSTRFARTTETHLLHAIEMLINGEREVAAQDLIRAALVLHRCELLVADFDIVATLIEGAAGTCTRESPATIIIARAALSSLRSGFAAQLAR